MPFASVFLQSMATGRKVLFDGVLSVSYSHSLRVSTDTDETAGTDFVSGARSVPDRLILAVAASDVNRGETNASQLLLSSLISLKDTMTLLRAVTPLRSYENMLLTDISVARDEESPFGWQGTLTLTKTNPEIIASRPAQEKAAAQTAPKKTSDNSSTKTNQGTTTAQTVSNTPDSAVGAIGQAVADALSASLQTSSPFERLLENAGIKVSNRYMTTY